MAVLRRVDGLRVSLGARTLVGRSPNCALRIEDRRVSGEHAVFLWRKGRWTLRDLGSRNGTRVQGRDVPPGRPHALELADRVGLGDQVWTLEDDGPPGALAVDLDSDEILPAEGGLLALPDEDNPLLTLYEEPGEGWMIEGEGLLEDRRELELEGRRLLLLAPLGAEGSGVGSTWEQSATRAIERCVLHFTVSADEEDVSLILDLAGEEHDLGTRAHHYLTLTLARQRLEDAREGLPVSERGWLSADELASMLRMDLQAQNLHIFRARKQLAALGIEGATGLVERRATSRSLRLGTGQVVVHSG